MSSIAEAMALAAPSFTGQLLLEDDAPDPAAVAYGPNLPRLRQIQTKYDPENFFRHKVNIHPNLKKYRPEWVA